MIGASLGAGAGAAMAGAFFLAFTAFFFAAGFFAFLAGFFAAFLAFVLDFLAGAFFAFLGLAAFFAFFFFFAAMSFTPWLCARHKNSTRLRAVARVLTSLEVQFSLSASHLAWSAPMRCPSPTAPSAKTRQVLAACRCDRRYERDRFPHWLS